MGVGRGVGGRGAVDTHGAKEQWMCVFVYTVDAASEPAIGRAPMTFTEVYLAPCRARLTVTIASRMDIMGPIRVRMLGNPRRRAGGRQDEPGSPGGAGLKSRGRMTGMALMRTIVFPMTVYVSGRTKSSKSFRTRVPRSTRRSAPRTSTPGSRASATATATTGPGKKAAVTRRTPAPLSLEGDNRAVIGGHRRPNDNAPEPASRWRPTPRPRGAFREAKTICSPCA